MADKERVPGVISANEAYTLEELKLRMKIEESAWWQLRDRGLRFTRTGKGLMILGSDVLKILGELSQCHESASRSVTVKGRRHLAFRWQDPVTRNWRQRTAGTANRRIADKAAARLEVSLSRATTAEECPFEQFEARYSDEWLASLSGGARVNAGCAFKYVREIPQSSDALRHHG